MLVYSNAVRYALLLGLGPLGCYALYHLAFVIRHLDQGRYPAVTAYYEWPVYMVDIALFAAALGASILWPRRFNMQRSDTDRPTLPGWMLGAMVAATATLMVLSVYRVLGTLNLITLAEQYPIYYTASRRGGAWMILVSYGILYILLVDMFFGRVRLGNSLTLLACVAIGFVNGGRGILTCVLLGFLFLLYLQRPPLKVLAAGMIGVAAIFFAGSMTATDLRRPPSLEDSSENPSENAAEDPTENATDLDFNAAFILDDVIRQMDAGSISPEPHVLYNLALLIPRSLYPGEKPKADSETRLVYPSVANRGTTISFPLKANLMLHFGTWAFYADWLFVAGLQIAFIWGALKRDPSLPAFLAFSTGFMFLQYSRGGIIDFRLVLAVLMISLAYGCWRVAIRLDGQTAITRMAAQ